MLKEQLRITKKIWSSPSPNPLPSCRALLNTYFNIYLEILVLLSRALILFPLLKLKVFLRAKFLVCKPFNVGSVSRTFSIIVWKPLLSVNLSVWSNPDMSENDTIAFWLRAHIESHKKSFRPSTVSKSWMFIRKIALNMPPAKFAKQNANYTFVKILQFQMFFANIASLRQIQNWENSIWKS